LLAHVVNNFNSRIFQVVQHPLLQVGNHLRAAAAIPLSLMPIQLGHDHGVDVQQVGHTPGRFDVKQGGAIEPLGGVPLAAAATSAWKRRNP
jgi:hypothetical protein